MKQISAETIEGTGTTRTNNHAGELETLQPYALPRLATPTYPISHAFLALGMMSNRLPFCSRGCVAIRVANR